MDIWLQTILVLLAGYGLVSLIISGAATFWLESGDGRSRFPRSFSLLFLILNQETILEPLFRQVFGLEYWGSNQGPDLEVVAVDTGSTDNSWAALEGLSKEYPGLRIARIDARAKGPETPGECALFLCRNRTVLTFDLRSRAELPFVLAELRYFLGR